MAEFLPDSRAKVRRGGIRSASGTLIPVYCANCGKPWGMVPEEHMTFAFVLCEGCAEKHGDVAHTYKEPDSVFWQRVTEAQHEEFGGILDARELMVQLADSTSVMSRLAAEWLKQVRKDY